MLRFMKTLGAAAALLAAAGLARAGDPSVVRVGYFPNVTHATGIVGFSPQKHTYYKKFPSVRFDNKLFNAGPAAIEALRAGALDMSFMGAGPAVNAFLRGKDIVILTPCVTGGSTLLIRKGSGIRSVADLAGRKVAIPQVGNTQDVLLRYQLALNRLRPVDRGGSVNVLQQENADILSLFQRNQLDAACVPEPWGSRLQKEAGATVLMDWRQLFANGDYPTTVLVARKDFADRNADFVRRFVKVTNSITSDIAARTQGYAPMLNSEIKRLSGKGLSGDIITAALKRCRFTTKLSQHDLHVFENLLVVAGFQKDAVPLDGILWK